MNIALVLPEMVEGGVERHVAALANALARASDKVYVVSNGGRLESLLSPGVVRVNMPVHEKNPATGMSCAFRLAAFAKRENITVIHAHSRVPAWICLFAKKFVPGVKYYYTAHAVFPRLNYGTWPIGKADGVICVSKTVRDSLKNWLPARARSGVIYNPLPDAPIPWRGSGGAAKRILFVGRLSEKKGILTVVEAMAKVKNQNWTLDIAGDGPLKRKLEARIAELGLGDKIRSLGFAADVPDKIAGCDLFVSPSRIEEGFGLSLCQALSAGAPVIASDLSATRELTVSGAQGRDALLPPGDADAWARAIGGFLDGTFYPSLKLAVTLPTIGEMAAETLRFYEGPPEEKNAGQMKIIHVLPELEEGGVERLVPVSANSQSERGRKVWVVSGGGRLEALLGAGVVHIKMPVYSKNPFRVVVCAFRLSRFAAREKVSILHAHSRVPAWICRIAKKMTPGVKFIYTAHARYGTLNSGLLPIGGADAVICVSEAVREYLASWLPGDASRTRVVYNPLPRAVLPWTGSGDARKKHLLFVGRISAKKDPATLLKAMSFHRDKAWELDIAGDGPLAPYLRKLIAELRLEGRVNALGFRDDVPELITRCDLFLFPSLDEEGLAVSLCEALAAGAPTIASDIAATRELTSPDGKNCGELLPVGDIAAWSEAIGRFLDGTFVPSLGIAVKIPTADEMADEILKIYDEAEREK